MYVTAGLYVLLIIPSFHADLIASFVQVFARGLRSNYLRKGFDTGTAEHLDIDIKSSGKPGKNNLKIR